MIFKYILVVFVYILNVLTGIVSSAQERSCHKLNVVLFFAKSAACHIPKEASGIKALEMHEVARVKHNFPAHHSLEQTSGDVLSRSARSGPCCKVLLRESLTSLVHFCQNALGMKTAVVSISNSEITNDINNSEPDTPPEIRERHFSDFQNVPRDVFHGDTNTKDMNTLQRQPPFRYPEVVKMRDVITSPEHTEVFKIRVKRQLSEVENEQPGEIVDVPLDKESKKHPWDVLDIMSHVRFSFFGKLFEDAAKKKLGEEENKIAEDLTQNKEDPGLFETVKTTLSALQENPEEPFFMTIFGGHLSEVSNVNSPLVQSMKHVIENTGSENTLIVLTGSCPEHHHGHEHGHLHNHELEHGHEVVHEPELEHGHQPEHGHELEHEVVHEPQVEHGHEFGEHEPGHGHEFESGHAAGHEHGVGHEHEVIHEHGHEHLHQRKRNTEHEQNVVHIDESTINEEHLQNGTIPVYARGPEYIKLSQCSLLFDVPVVVKSILEQMAPTFEGQSRPKRSIFGDIRMNKENYENMADRVNPYQSVIFNLCVFTLFII